MGTPPVVRLPDHERASTSGKQCVFFFKQKTAYEVPLRLVGSEMCIRDRSSSTKRRFIAPVVISKLLSEFGILFRREIHCVSQRKLGRILTPMILMPLLFAFALAICVDAKASRQLIWFFAVLSCIWMGSSIALLSVAGERRVHDHEAHLFLGQFPYLLAKMCSACLLYTSDAADE